MQLGVYMDLTYTRRPPCWPAQVSVSPQIGAAVHCKVALQRCMRAVLSTEGYMEDFVDADHIACFGLAKGCNDPYIAWHATVDTAHIVQCCMLFYV